MEFNMSEITPALVKTLRERTGAGMMDCKKALMEVSGDLEAAVDWLRKKGLAAAAKKAGRVAAEGLVGIAATADGKSAAVIEINAETDFIARNEHFQNLVSQTAKIAAANTCDVDALLTTSFPGEGGTVQGEITRLIALIGENMNLRRISRLSVTNGAVATYMHNATTAGLGRIGVSVALESTGDAAKLMELGKKISMHIAAAHPQALNIDAVDPTMLERERTILVDQARASGRPEDVIQKMVEGRVRKYYEEIVLLEQPFVMDGKTKISEVVANAAQELGTDVKLTGFIRYALGEGIEKEESDFAAEVMAQAKMA
jgi:elongation factor Ts